MAPEISISEVKKHKNKKSLWMIIHNDVYDVTKFLAEHPGGEDTLLENGGKDGTQAFEDVGHSEDARELMKKYKIGTLPASEKKKDIPENCLPPPCPSCNAASTPKPESKSWRTYDGSSCSQSRPHKSSFKAPKDPVASRRCDTIIVPRERKRPPSPQPRKRPPSPPPSSKLKWALLALAGALIIGIVLKKTMG